MAAVSFPAPQSGARTVTAAEFAADLAPPSYILRPVLQRGYLYALTAQPNHGKTALAHLWAFYVASGKTGGSGLKAHRGRVLILCGENPDDSRLRFVAASKALGVPLAGLEIHVWSGAAPLAGILPRVIADANAIGEFLLVIVDTSAAYFSYEDENDNTQARQHAQDCRKLTEINGTPTVLVLCHPTKSAGADKLLPRGGSGFWGEIDANLTLWSDGEVVTLSHEKIRGPAFEPRTYRLAVVDSGIKDIDNQPVVSVIVEPVEQQAEDVIASQRGEDEDALLGVLAAQAGKKASLAELAERCGWVSPTGSPSKTKAQRVLRRLQDDRLVRRYRSRWVLTAQGRREASAGT